MMCRLGDGYSLIPKPSITANAVEGLVKLLRRMTSGGRLEAWHFRWTAVLCMHGAISHASRRPPDVILCRSFTRPSTALAVIEGLGTRLGDGLAYTTNNTLKVHMWLVGSMKKWLGQTQPAWPLVRVCLCYRKELEFDSSCHLSGFIQVQAVTNHRFCHGLNL